MEEKNEKYEGEVKIKIPISKKLENFWYHYKWHSIVAAFLIIVITICSFQMCSKTKYDIHIIYAGTHEIKHTAKDGDLSPYLNMTKSLKKVCEDFDNDGNVNINLLNLFVLNEEEINAALEGTSGKEINKTLITEDASTLNTTLVYGEHYVCFLSERIFLEKEAAYEGALFAPLSPYTEEGVEYEYASERGIFLRSLQLYRLPEICNLPEDTVVCIRQLSEVSSVFGKAENEENFRRGEEVMKKILSFK